MKAAGLTAVAFIADCWVQEQYPAAVQGQTQRNLGLHRRELRLQFTPRRRSILGGLICID